MPYERAVVPVARPRAAACLDGRAACRIAPALRCADDFGLYRLVWLVVLTLTTAVSAFIDTLFVYLPRVSMLLLPRMSRELSQGNSSTVIQLNNSVNIAVAAVLFPLLSYVPFYAGPLVEPVYTSKLIDAAPVMRIMLLACALQVVDLNSLSLLLKQGKFTTALNGALLAVAAAKLVGRASLGTEPRAAGQHGGHLCRAHPAGATPGARDEPAGAPAAALGGCSRCRPRSPWRPARYRTSWLSGCTSVRFCGHLSWVPWPTWSAMSRISIGEVQAHAD
jgi:hypothetical protein